MRWKWIVMGVCGLIVALIIAAVVILSTYNFNSLKPQITKAAKEATGRDLTLGGDIRLKISLTPALVMENVRPFHCMPGFPGAVINRPVALIDLPVRCGADDRTWAVQRCHPIVGERHNRDPGAGALVEEILCEK